MSLAKRLLEQRNYNSRNTRKRFGSKNSDMLSFAFQKQTSSLGLGSKEIIDEFNEEIRKWGVKVKNDLGYTIDMWDINDTGALKQSIKNNFYKNSYGETFKLGFSFKRYGVFVQKGLGTGYLQAGDKVIKISKSKGFNRHPRPWFNPVIEDYMPDLQEIITKYCKDAIINTNRIYINS